MFDTHDYRQDALDWLTARIRGCTSAVKMCRQQVSDPYNGATARIEITRNGMQRTGYTILFNTLNQDEDMEPWELADRLTRRILQDVSTPHQGEPDKRYDVETRKVNALFCLEWGEHKRD